MNEDEGGSLHRSAEIEDLTHLTKDDKKKIEEKAHKGVNDNTLLDTHSSIQSSIDKPNSHPT
jgi:hypothetical protein